MKTRQLFTFLCASPFVLSMTSGCIFLKAPEPDQPLPAPRPLPKVIFDPTDGTARGLKLNDPATPPFDPKAPVAIPVAGAPAAPVLPNAFRLARAVSGDTVILQSVKKVKAGGDKIIDSLGAPDVNNPVRLAGIITPALPAPGAQNSITTLFKWVAGKDLDVDIDPKYPADTDGRRLVHIFFKGQTRTNAKGQSEEPLLSLNRMMVRSGFAIVDLYSPTSFDQKQWLLDEAYAREHRAGLWKTNAFPLLQQRLPSTGTGQRSQVKVVVQAPAPAPSAPTTGAAPVEGAVNNAPAAPAGAATAGAPTPAAP